MEVINTTIEDVKVIVPKIFSDERGFFYESFKSDWFNKNIISKEFVQENHSLSKRGTLRGLHYQLKKPQGKLVRVTKGNIFDVVVDLRRSSQTFGNYFSINLSEDNKYQLWVPEGFAHGFLVLSEYAEFQYKCTDYYSPEDERVLAWDDKFLKIAWPRNEKKPYIISKKDAMGSSFKDCDYFA